jgi:hypothetical protein
MAASPFARLTGATSLLQQVRRLLLRRWALRLRLLLGGRARFRVVAVR